MFPCSAARQFLPRTLFDCLKGMPMPAIIVAMIIIFGVVAGTAGLVVVGIEGRFKRRAPRLADSMARAAQHLNGDGEPPARFNRILR
jgi:hypothetical protein